MTDLLTRLNPPCSIQLNLESKGNKLGLGDLSKPTALLKSKFRSILTFGTLVLWYLTLVGHTQSQICHLKSVILKVMVGRIESYDIAS